MISKLWNATNIPKYRLGLRHFRNSNKFLEFRIIWISEFWILLLSDFKIMTCYPRNNFEIRNHSLSECLEYATTRQLSFSDFWILKCYTHNSLEIIHFMISNKFLESRHFMISDFEILKCCQHLNSEVRNQQLPIIHILSDLWFLNCYCGSISGFIN